MNGTESFLAKQTPRYKNLDFLAEKLSLLPFNFFLRRLVFSILIFWSMLSKNECNNQVLTLLISCPDEHREHLNLLVIYIYVLDHLKS